MTRPATSYSPCAQTFLIRMTQLVPQARFSEFEKTATVSLSGTGTFATVCKVLTLPAKGIRLIMPLH